MKFLVVEQDLRVSGTSQGIISRSFLAKLRMAYPNAVIDVLYLKTNSSDDQLELLPVDSIQTHILNIKIPKVTKWLNKINWRLFHVSLLDKYIHKTYASYISKIDYVNYEHIFIRSSGLNHETILACKDLPILKKAIVNFHDPYPLFWYPGANKEISGLELFKMKEMFEVVKQAKTCTSTAISMSQDLEYLYGNRKKFYTLPHQYSSNVFNLNDTESIFKSDKKIMISYHGAMMLGRNIDILLDSYSNLLIKNNQYIDDTIFVVRLRGQENDRLSKKYRDIKNIKILDTLNFSNSCYEQVHQSSINIILENGPLYSNTLVGKAPFLASISKPIMVLAPERSELRKHIQDEKYIANYDNSNEVEEKLEELINDVLTSNEPVNPFGNYFSDENFKLMLNKILYN